MLVKLTKKANGFFFCCVESGKHYRAFIMDQDYLKDVLDRLKKIGRANDV